MAAFWERSVAVCAAFVVIAHQVEAVPVVAHQKVNRVGGPASFLATRHAAAMHSSVHEDSQAKGAPGTKLCKVLTMYTAPAGDFSWLTQREGVLGMCRGHFTLKDEKGPVYESGKYADVKVYVYWDDSDSQWICGNDTDVSTAMVKMPAKAPRFPLTPPVMAPVEDITKDSTYLDGDSFADSKTQLSCSDPIWTPPMEECSTETAQESKESCLGLLVETTKNGNFAGKFSSKKYGMVVFCNWDKCTKKCAPITCEPGEDKWQKSEGGGRCSSLATGQINEGACGEEGYISSVDDYFDAYQVCPQCGCRPAGFTEEEEDDDADDSDDSSGEKEDEKTKGNATVDDADDEETPVTPVVVVINIHNLDYSILASDQSLHARVEAAVRDAIASEAGEDIDSDDVSLVSWPGSVRARAVLKPANDVESTSIVEELKKSSRKLDKLIATKVSNILGIKAAIKGKLVADFDVLVATRMSSVSRVMAKPKGHDHLTRVYELERKAAAARQALGYVEAEEQAVMSRLADAEKNATTAEQDLNEARNDVTESWYGKQKKAEEAKSHAALLRCGPIPFLFASLVGWCMIPSMQM